jgi:hypothetical protein
VNCRNRQQQKSTWLLIADSAIRIILENHRCGLLVAKNCTVVKNGGYIDLILVKESADYGQMDTRLYLASSVDFNFL